ncbi:MAG: universal stress protein [Nitrososphaerota archaeon]|jgi:nucleotide-binding universal stress UspA family protein|nr:universal stress protein [Nitrososphaerota archaeon]MDG6937276.1 universal stress protein [Nitrososphaerota archaeon]MDG6961364.1 universal stress protein [Nitrososphaerota archaeon]MDG6962818.1 universal stress protein [Nitrososphaerota archaeon]MDG6970350.1 universal stress protein [Nitrososphaerota archaeon]
MAANDKVFQNVVVAFDGSSDSVKAVQLACSIVSKFGSALTVVHVYSSPAMVFAGGPGMPIPNYSELEEAAKGTAAATLSRGVQTAGQYGVKAKGEVIEASSVVEALVGYATDQGVDLIVTGTRGMTGFKKLIMGSVTSGLVSHSHCPVLVVR